MDCHWHGEGACQAANVLAQLLALAGGAGSERATLQFTALTNNSEVIVCTWGSDKLSQSLSKRETHVISAQSAVAERKDGRERFAGLSTSSELSRSREYWHIWECQRATAGSRNC